MRPNALRLLALAGLAAAGPAATGFVSPVRAEKLADAWLWQERYYWDGLIQSRDRAARQAADPRLLQVVESIAQQVAQQSANLQQIQDYAKSQIEGIQFALTQEDPAPSLAVVQGNFTTLGQGAEQVRNNLYYLTARLRMASSQALPDPKLTEQASVLIAQIQDVQLKLNALYTDSSSVSGAVADETAGVDPFFRFHATRLLNAVVEVQDSVFAVYNAAYELYLLSK